MLRDLDVDRARIPDLSSRLPTHASRSPVRRVRAPDASQIPILSLANAFEKSPARYDRGPTARSPISCGLEATLYIVDRFPVEPKLDGSPSASYGRAFVRRTRGDAKPSRKSCQTAHHQALPLKAARHPLAGVLECVRVYIRRPLRA